MKASSMPAAVLGECLEALPDDRRALRPAAPDVWPSGYPACNVVDVIRDAPETAAIPGHRSV